MADKKNKRPSLMFRSMTKDGKGVSKEEADSGYGFKSFFSIYFRRFRTIVSINLLFIFGNFPILLAMFARSGNIGIETLYHKSTLYPLFRGIMASGNYNPVTAALNGVVGVRGTDYILTTPAYVLFFIALLLLLITFGLVNVGCTYIIRNLIRREPIFLFQDFFYAIKRNWKQGLLYGVIDACIIGLLIFDIYFFYFNMGTFFGAMEFYLCIMLAILYFIMRFYTYVMLVTFDLSLFKIIKNSAIFAIVGLKRNVCALAGMIAFFLLSYALFFTYVPLGIIILIVLGIATLVYMGIYASYPKIKEVMIDPYLKDHPEEVPVDPTVDIEPIFRDDVTTKIEIGKRHDRP